MVAEHKSELTERSRKMKKAILISIMIWAILSLAALSYAMDVRLACDPNSESDLAGYRIYWSQTSGQYSTAQMQEYPLASITPATPEFIVTNLSETGRWYFVATAYDTEARESLYSNEVSYQWDGVTGIPPAPPGGLKPLEITVVRPDGTRVVITIP